MVKNLNYLMLIFILLLNTGCSKTDNVMERCESEIPLFTDFQYNATFSSLRYHMRDLYKLSAQKGYDLWADSKFEFNSALQFSFVPKEKYVTNKFCINSAFLRLTLPLNATKKAMITAFTQEVAARTGMDALKIQQKVDNLIINSVKFKLIARNNHALIKAGVAHHQFRGDIFVVAIETDPTYFNGNTG